jgi:uracil-DNA glycosylase family 4
MFTGDRSGDWLYRALHRASVASQANSDSADDGLVLSGAMITAVCHCAPPDNKPTPAEVEACRPFLLELLETRPWRAVLCLGGIAWTNTLAQLGARPVPKFGHGVEYDIRSTRVFGSYHPSQQNTFTGRLTEVMLDEVVQRWASY